MSEDEDDELQEREDQMGRVSVTLIALAERALTGGQTHRLLRGFKLCGLGAEAPRRARARGTRRPARRGGREGGLQARR